MGLKSSQDRVEAIRRSIQASEQIATLSAISEVAKTADKDQIPALRLQADIAFGLLRKVLPDLKAIELSGGGDPITVNIVKYADYQSAKP